MELLNAVMKRDPDEILQLLEAGAPLVKPIKESYQNFIPVYPCAFACTIYLDWDFLPRPIRPRVEIARLLIEHGALECEEDGGCAALICAARYRFHDLVCYLVEAGATLNLTHENMGFVIYSAAMHDSEVLELLLAKGADLNTTLLVGNKEEDLLECDDLEFAPAMWLAAHELRGDIIDALLRAGADFNVTSSLGFTALDELQERLETDEFRCQALVVVRILISRGEGDFHSLAEKNADVQGWLAERADGFQRAMLAGHPSMLPPLAGVISGYL